MRYVMKQKFWSFGDDFRIQDEERNDVFIVDGKAFSWGDKLSFQDTDCNEVAYISQKLLTLMPRYHIYRAGELFAEVVKKFSWFRENFLLDVPGPNDYAIEGSFWDHEYSFTRGNRLVAQVSKRYFAWTDTYGVDINEDEDDITILATVVVIDLVCHDDNDD